MKRFFQALDGSWFTEAPPARLALLRILVGAYALYYVGTRFGLLTRLSESNPSLFEPVGIAAFLNRPLPPTVFQALVVATLAANVAFLLGWRHRFTGPAFAGLLLGVLCYRNSWSMIFHSDNVLVLHVIILGLAPAADALSVSSLAHSAWQGNVRARTGAAYNPAGYGWAIRLMCAVTVISYFLAGVAKVAGPLGWSWVTGEALRSQVAMDAFRKELLGGEASPVFLLLYEQTYLFTLLAVMTFVLELGAPAALLSRRLSYVWVINVFLMHWGVFFIMGILFRYQLAGVMFASFFPLERVIAWTKLCSSERFPQREAHHVLRST